MSSSIQLIDKVRDYFGLSDLEKPTETGGVLQVHIGDVFSPSEDASGRYAGEISFQFFTSFPFTELVVLCEFAAYPVDHSFFFLWVCIKA